MRDQPRLRHCRVLRRGRLGPGDGFGDAEFPAHAGTVSEFALEIGKREGAAGNLVVTYEEDGSEGVNMVIAPQAMGTGQQR